MNLQRQLTAVERIQKYYHQAVKYQEWFQNCLYQALRPEKHFLCRHALSSNWRKGLIVHELLSLGVLLQLLKQVFSSRTSLRAI